MMFNLLRLLSNFLSKISVGFSDSDLWTIFLKDLEMNFAIANIDKDHLFYPWGIIYIYMYNFSF